MPKIITTFIIFLLFGTVGFCQMTDQQIIDYVRENKSAGVSDRQIALGLSQRGVTQEQILRIQSQNKDSGATLAPVDPAVQYRGREMEEPEDQQKPYIVDTTEYTVFGANIFNSGRVSFEPNLNMATPENYILGPGDEIIVDIWGNSENNLRLTISPNGNIMIPAVGPMYLSGLSIKEASSRIRGRLSTIYSQIGEGGTYVEITLGNIRSIRVNVMGEVSVPGSYTLPSLATLFHAIYIANGMNPIGSFRSVKLFRAGKEFIEVDLYDYLLGGRSDLDVNLKDGDLVMVYPYENMVSIEGGVKRPLSYEMKSGQSLAELIEYAGGFSSDAYKKSVRIVRQGDIEFQVFNVDEQDFRNFTLRNGDFVTVDKILQRFENRVEIRGAIFREGIYAIDQRTSTVKELIEKAEGVREDAFMDRAILYREKPDLTVEVVPVNIAALLQNTIPDITLRKNDNLYIPSIFDLREDYTIKIYGEVGNPGTYMYADNLTVEDVIIKAGGLLESASAVNVQVARRIRDPKSLEAGETLAQTFLLTVKDGLVIDGPADFNIMPFDEIYIRKSPGYEIQQNVLIEGKVHFPGEYVIHMRGEKLSDLLQRAGGVTEEAYLQGARLVRKMTPEEQLRVNSVLKLSENTGNDTINVSQLDLANTYYVGIELDKAIADPGSIYDITLREGDRIIVPEYTKTVKINGAVMHQNTVVYIPKKRLSHYINQAGGYSPIAKRSRAYVVYMNGTVSRVKRSSELIKPGCEIIVPQKIQRNRRMSLAEVMTIPTSAASLAALVTTIVNQTK